MARFHLRRELNWMNIKMLKNFRDSHRTFGNNRARTKEAISSAKI